MPTPVGVNQPDHSASIVDRILTAVAEEKQCMKLDLPPLYDVTDPDALEKVLQGTGVSKLTFSYHGCSVSIVRDGQVCVTPEGA